MKILRYAAQYNFLMNRGEGCWSSVVPLPQVKLVFNEYSKEMKKNSFR